MLEARHIRKKGEPLKKYSTIQKEMGKMDKKLAIKKAESLKDVGGDASYAEGVFKRSKAKKEALKRKAEDDRTLKRELAKRRESKGLKDVKDAKEEGWWGKMSDSDKATVLMGAGKGVLSGIKGYHEAKDRRKQRMLTGLTSAHDMRAKAGHALIGAPVSLRKGGKVSFKDVLKAKKKMGY